MAASKSLNNSYNLGYNDEESNVWAEQLTGKLDRRKAEITFNPHLFDRKEYWNLDLGKIEKTVRTGKLLDDKCLKPNKLCFKLYFGKENVTYTAITRYYDNFIEVKTAWAKKGR